MINDILGDISVSPRLSYPILSTRQDITKAKKTITALLFFVRFAKSLSNLGFSAIFSHLEQLPRLNQQLTIMQFLLSSLAMILVSNSCLLMVSAHPRNPPIIQCNLELHPDEIPMHTTDLIKPIATAPATPLQPQDERYF